MCGKKPNWNTRISPNESEITCKNCVGRAPPSELQRYARKKFEALGAIAMAQVQLKNLGLWFKEFSNWPDTLQNLDEMKIYVNEWYEDVKRKYQK